MVSDQSYTAIVDCGPWWTGEALSCMQNAKAGDAGCKDRLRLWAEDSSLRMAILHEIGLSVGINTVSLDSRKELEAKLLHAGAEIEQRCLREFPAQLF